MFQSPGQRSSGQTGGGVNRPNSSTTLMIEPGTVLPSFEDSTGAAPRYARIPLLANS